MQPQANLTLHTGASIPVMGLGTWMLTDQTDKAVETALEQGYRLIDTSGDYGTQPGIGRGIEESDIDRSEFYLVTKVEETDDAYAKTKADLEELGLDYADLMLVHRPPEQGAGKGLWRGLIKAQEEGLTRDIGVSNYPIDLIEELIEATGITPTVNQIEWSPFGHSEEMLRYADKKGIVIQAYSPLTRAERLEDERLVEMAGRYGKSPAQILIRWNLQHGTIPLPKANHRTHLMENIDVFDFEISEEDMAALDGMNEHYSALGTLPYV